jgi:hypothetical protein
MAGKDFPNSPPVKDRAMSDIVLEPAAQEFADATAKPPLLYELGVEGARKLLDDVQSGPVEKLDVDETSSPSAVRASCP